MYSFFSFLLTLLLTGSTVSYIFDTSHLSSKALDHIIKQLARQLQPLSPPISPFVKGYYGYSGQHYVDSLRRRLSREQFEHQTKLINDHSIPELKNIKITIQKIREDSEDDIRTNPFEKRNFDHKEKKDEEDDQEFDEDKRITEPNEDEVVTSGNFEVFHKTSYSFQQIGGYASVKEELIQSVDMLTNYKLYEEFNVRTPKGLILEGPPGNGKTLLAKCLSGEVNAKFIPVSGSHFSDTYVGVGAKRIREMFHIARKNKPCIIFIDEIDAVGRKRSSDGVISGSSERDSTLNELLVGLDGFKSSKGIFLIGATNRYDLLDPALTRPGRIDKRIYLGNPDKDTRKAIIDIHIQGKPYCKESVNTETLLEISSGMSGAQIENVLNEAMLSALRRNEKTMLYSDIELALSKMMVGWQPNQHEFSEDMLRRISIHEMGHCLLGLIASASGYHPNVVMVKINLFAPKTPGYTVFESSTNSNIYKREELTSHLMILLGGRIAEEVVYGQSVTTGASDDIEKATNIAIDMVQKYALTSPNKHLPPSLYPSVLSEKAKEKVDEEVHLHLLSATTIAFEYLVKCKNLLVESSELLLHKKVLRKQDIMTFILERYPELKSLFT